MLSSVFLWAGFSDKMLKEFTHVCFYALIFVYKQADISLLNTFL